jgi:dienelactone hydrolase
MMTLLPYWFVIEEVVIIAIVAFFLWRVTRSIRRNKTTRIAPPKALGARIRFTLLYVLRIFGLGLGVLLVVVLFVIADRVTYAVITDTMPAPSEVSVPAGLPFEVKEVAFEGGDDLRMAGWKVPSQNGATIILLHGYGGNRTQMLWHAKRLVEAGYGVLMYDERASGESEGTRRSFGWEDPRDAEGAIHFIETGSSRGGERIGIAGCSIGGQIALQSAAYYPELEAVWADGPGIVRARDIPPPKDPIQAAVYLANYSLDWAYKVKLDMEPPAALVDIIGGISPRPIMLVGGGQPHPLVGSEGENMVPRYAHYAGSNAQTWVIPEAYHCDGPARRPEEYAARMIKFFDTAFGITR